MAVEDGAAPAPEAERVLPQGAAVRFSDGALRVSLAATIYRTEAILRSCYWLTDRCYLYLAPSNDDLIEVTMLAKSGNPGDTNQCAWDFLEDLIDQSLRIQINDETRVIRELIVGQAFAEVDLIDDRGRVEPQRDEHDGSSDPRGLPEWRPVS